MKNAAVILNAVLLVAVGVLFYLHFFSEKKGATSVVKGTSQADTSSGNFRIAYFELDSITNSFAMVKDVKNELSKEEERINMEMTRLQKRYNDKLSFYQKQGEMSQVQSEEASREMMKLQDQIRNAKQNLDQKFQDNYMRKMQEVRTEIEKFLKEYNKTKGYTYILANEPQIIYFRDTAYDVTADLIKGLNEQYSKKK
jgi:outer membrane protein